jgi:hypothetical protein
VPELLAAVTAVGADPQPAGAGWCAKGGQRRAVWATAPSLVLAAMAVAGGRSGRSDRVARGDHGDRGDRGERGER